MAVVSDPATRFEVRPVTRSVTGVPRRLAVIVRAESRGFDRYPGGRWLVLGAALACGLAFGGLRPGIERFYPESVPILVLALAAGILGRTPAALLVLGYVVTDALRFLPAWNGQWSLFTGRMIGWVVLWVLAGAVPLFARRTAGSILDALPVRIAGSRGAFVRGIVGSLILLTAAFAFMQAMAYLVGAAYPSRNPAYPDVAPLQEASPLIAALAAGLHLIRVLVLRDPTGDQADAVEVSPTFRQWSVGGVAARVVAYALIVFLAQPLTSDQLDLAILAGALAAAEGAAFVIGRVPAASAGLAALPELVRGALGVLVGATVGIWLFLNWGTSKMPTEYYPFVVGIAVSLALLRILWSPVAGATTRVTDGTRPARALPTGAIAVGIVGLGALAWVAMPARVYADNCTGIVDCVRGAASWAWAAFCAGAAFFWSWAKGVFGKLPPIIGALEPAASEEGAAAEQGGFNAFQGLAANRAMADGNLERASAIREMSTADFYNAAKNGDFADLGIQPF